MLPQRHSANRILLSFGFEDGVSQPLLQGVDEQDKITKDPDMVTPQNVITVPASPANAPPIHAKSINGVSANPAQRPQWMKEGSFLVFRKLEQNVPEFDSLMERFAALESSTADRCAAKLMGRWKNGRFGAL